MNFVQLRSYDNYLRANMQLSILKEEGINCYIKDEYTITIDPLLSPAIGGMKLMVEEEEWDTASKILDASDNKYLETVACPNCHQHTLNRVLLVQKPSGFFEKLKFRLINGQEAEVKKYFQCGTCGIKLEELPISE